MNSENSEDSTILSCPWCHVGTVTIRGSGEMSLRICCAQCLHYYRVDTPSMTVTRWISRARRLIFRRSPHGTVMTETLNESAARR